MCNNIPKRKEIRNVREVLLITQYSYNIFIFNLFINIY